MIVLKNIPLKCRCSSTFTSTTNQATSEIEHDYCEPNMQGFVFGAHYSVVCPLGELGDVHRSEVLAVITKEQFEKAKTANWNVEINFL